MRVVFLMLAAAVLGLPACAESGPVLRMDFSNPGLSPSQWTLVIYPEGKGHFQSWRGNAPAADPPVMETPNIDRDIRLSPQFVNRVFQIVRDHRLLRAGCDSRLKVAFQGWKKLTYVGPEGEGVCEFNYSKDKEIQALGDSLVAVSATIVEGARLEILLQHDPLGLDMEMEFVTEASNDGRLQQISVIRGTLERLEETPGVMERVRKRAGVLLARTEK